MTRKLILPDGKLPKVGDFRDDLPSELETDPVKARKLWTEGIKKMLGIQTSDVPFKDQPAIPSATDPKSTAGTD